MNNNIIFIFINFLIYRLLDIDNKLKILTDLVNSNTNNINNKLQNIENKFSTIKNSTDNLIFWSQTQKDQLARHELRARTDQKKIKDEIENLKSGLNVSFCL